MPDIFTMVAKWWKPVALLVGATVGLAALLLLFLPKEYKAVATALPASSVAADRGRIFNTNIQNLYSPLGEADDLDRIQGTANLDTLYLTLAREHNLASHYKIRSAHKIAKAARQLKKNTAVVKSEWGELKINVWDKDPKKAAVLANSLLQHLRQLHQKLQNESNHLTLLKLRENYTQLQKAYLQQKDSITTGDNELYQIKAKSGLEELYQYQKLISEYQLMLNTNPQVLLTVENARPPLKADRPKIAQTLAFVLFASLLFGIGLAYFLERGKRNETA